MAGQETQQPITITNAQGQQITVIPTQALHPLRPANANIIQMPSVPTGIHQFPIQNIPGLGNVQVPLFFNDFIFRAATFSLSFPMLPVVEL